MVRRSEQALKLLRDKYPPSLLRTRADDVVRTARFTIVGRITTPTLKAKAEEFGELELRPARLLALRALGDEANKEIVIDAATYGAQGSAKWLATGVQVDTYRGLRITATGQVDQWPQQPGQYLCGPDGVGAGNGGANNIWGNVQWGNVQPIRNQVWVGGGGGGALLGRIGENGATFVIGSQATRSPKTAGQLYLQIAPSPWNCPSTGAYRVTITSGPFADDHDRDE